MFTSGTARAVVTTCALAVLVLATGCRGDVRSIKGDFCHGVADGSACDDGDSCTIDDRCGDNVCVGRPVANGTVCDDGVACTVDDECQGGSCVGLDVCQEPDAIGGDGVTTTVGCAGLASGDSCDDGDPCTVADTCDGHTCRGSAMDCSDLDATCAAGVCEAGACVVHTLSDGASCDDQDPCSVGESCLAGSCGGAVFSPDGSPCSDGDAATINDRCASGVCAGTARSCDAACCDAAAGTLCDDGDLCTSADRCEKGFCVGTPLDLDCTSLDTACLEGRCNPATGTCGRAALPSGLPCSDGDLCTVNDACQAGSCVGATVDCHDLDSACLVGVCEAETGACAIVPRANGMPCNDGDPCTGHDDCTDAICGGEVDLCGACTNKQPGDPCDDGDACSTAAGVCVQVAGGLRCEVQLQVCSDPGATCAVDTCDAESGDCALVSLHDRATCDDGDPCTDHDTCASGECVGTARELCEAAAPDFCETAAPNDAIGGAIPLAVSAAGVRVLGTLDHGADTDWYSFYAAAGQLIDVTTEPHCGSIAATSITIVRPAGGVTVSSGGDSAWASVSGARAEVDGTYHVAIASIGDVDAATYFVTLTTRDAPACVTPADCGCDTLTCATGGAGAGTCVPALPVASEPDDGVAKATPLTLDQPVLARLVSPSDQDWFRLQLTGGAALDVTTAPACDDTSASSAVDDALRLYASDGTTELALARDDGAGGTHARLSGFVVPTGGTYYVRVTGEAGSVGTYTITASLSGCSADQPCLCSDQVCDPSGATALCVPRLTAPEPASSTAPPVALLLSQRVHGAIGVPYDRDSFQLTLGEGRYDVVTTSFCGAALDTTLEVWDDSGPTPTLLASDDDSGLERFARVGGLNVGAAQTLRVVVGAGGAAVGDYIITVRATVETP